jgi:hypothetical protein
MWTFDRLSSSSALPWLISLGDRLRRTLLARRPAVRLGLMLAVGFGLAAAGYWTAMSLVPLGSRYLDPGRSFSSQDLLKIGRALRAKGIEYHIDDRKVEVTADQYDQAVAVYTKLDLGPRPLDELKDPPDSWSFLDTLDEREWKRRLQRERFLEAIISKLDGVVSSLVSIHYPRARTPWHREHKLSAFVYLETQSDRPLPSQTVQLIPAILMGNEPELRHETITLVDGDGHRYLDPHNPALGDLSRDKAREDEIREDILQKLSWIRGLHVWVELTERHPGAGAVVSAAAARPEPAHADRSPAIGVNQPLELSQPGPPQPPAAAEGDAAKPGRGDRVERGRILVNVPRSFYFEQILPRGDHHEPSPEELHGMAARIKDQIVKAVNLVVPDPELWSVDVDTIPDGPPLGRPAVLPAGSDSRRKVMDWGIVASIAAAVAVLAALGSWIQLARHPARQPGPSPQTRRYRADFAGEPSSSERVRELVRRDPEAAASVLQRWIWAAQGGRVS